MSAWTLCSCLAPQIESFINLRRLSGTDYHSQAELLGYFDRFLVQQDIQQPRMTREILDRYHDSLSALAPRTQGNRFGVVRQLCQYLTRTDPLSYVPEPLPSSSSRQPHRPYIFTHGQIGALLTAASRLPPPGSLRPHTVGTLLGLLVTTGIRSGEAFSLNIEHFLPGEGKLYVAEGKFRKSRWSVLSASTTGALRQYLDRRRGVGANAPDSPLFLNQRRHRLRYAAVRDAFMHLLHECGIPWTRRAGPRIHHMRHTFAVHRLLAWYRDGEDINARLPALATYMGHVNINSTQVYLQATGARASEVVNMELTDLRLDAAQVTLHGKGNKDRSCPLWPETVAALEAYIKQRQPKTTETKQVFLNANGEPISRFGIRHVTRKYGVKAQAKQPSIQDKPLNPHRIRHTTAMHLLRAGNDINMVSYWLGHAHLNTTHAYVEIDMETKRKMLDKTPAPKVGKKPPWHRPSVLQWLKDLTKGPELCAVNDPRRAAKAGKSDKGKAQLNIMASFT